MQVPLVGNESSEGFVPYVESLLHQPRAGLHEMSKSSRPPIGESAAYLQKRQRTASNHSLRCWWNATKSLDAIGSCLDLSSEEWPGS